MSKLVRVVAVCSILAALPAVAAAEGHPHGDPAAPQAASDQKQETCEHGVGKAICSRCNPKLAAVYKAKGDWCSEHQRAESQCVLCHPELAKKGVK
jgi:hypothetical protein